MSSQSTQQVTHEENTGLLARTMHSEVKLSEARLELRDFAHRKFIPAIKRAQDDDDAQDTFTSSAGNLGTAGWMLTELALRVAELSDKKG
jgi:hypothetical protein